MSCSTVSTMFNDCNGKRYGYFEEFRGLIPKYLLQSSDLVLAKRAERSYTKLTWFGLPDLRNLCDINDGVRW